MKRFFLLVFLFLILPFSARAAEAPQTVYVGAYINDIQDIDLQTHSYRLDLYVWFRWKDPAIDPSKSVEFMNAFNPADHVRTDLYDEPQQMPDGSLYAVIREQGEFSAKFPLQRYPFDRQHLEVEIEDSLHAADALVYVADDKARVPVSINPLIKMPGYNPGEPRMEIADYPYVTNFGDISMPEPQPYSRAAFVVPVTRPWVTTGVKVFLPIALVVFCTALVFLVHPAYIEGRLGVAITALLTLVALQLTTASALPDVDYLLLTDKMYLLSYGFILATLLQLARMSRLVHTQSYDAVRMHDRQALAALCFTLVAGVTWILWIPA